MERTELSEYSEDEVVSRYLSSPWPEDDDPVDDCLRVLKIAVMASGLSPSEAGALIGESFSTYRSGGPIQAMFNWIAETCSSVYPDISASSWLSIVGRIVAARYGGSKVYVKKKKKVTPDMVRGMRPKEIMDTFGVSRSYAYRLLGK